MPYSVPFQSVGQQPVFDRESVMHHNGWDTLTTHTDQLPTNVNLWQYSNRSPDRTVLPHEPQITLTTCEAISDPNISYSNETPWHSTFNKSLTATDPPITQCNEKIQISPISDDERYLLSPNNTLHAELFEWAKSKLASFDEGNKYEWLPETNEMEISTEIGDAKSAVKENGCELSSNHDVLLTATGEREILTEDNAKCNYTNVDLSVNKQTVNTDTKDMEKYGGFTSECENFSKSNFEDSKSQKRDNLILYFKRTATDLWVVKNKSSTNTSEKNEKRPKSKECQEKSFECKKCPKTFSHKTSLNNHMLTHSKIKPHICSFCEKAFKFKNTLKTHILGQHTNERDFICHVCDKRFYQKGTLKSHLVIHTGDKPYKCTICEKGFTQGGSLKLHLYTHSENKPFNCMFCNKGFIKSSIFNAHMKSHQGEKLI